MGRKKRVIIYSDSIYTYRSVRSILSLVLFIVQSTITQNRKSCDSYICGSISKSEPICTKLATDDPTHKLRPSTEFRDDVLENLSFAILKPHIGSIDI